MRKSIVGILLSLASGWALSQVTLPYTFTPGTSAKAAEVNADLQALATAVNNLNARVQKLEGTIVATDLVGTYAVNRFQSELGGGNGARMSMYTGRGTVTLAAGGTGTIKGNTESGHLLSLSSLQLSAINNPAESQSIKWSYANGVVTLFGMPFNVVAGGRLLVATNANMTDGTNVIVLLTRTK